MNNVISIREIRIKLALKEATVALVKARTLISDGKVVPEDCGFRETTDHNN